MDRPNKTQNSVKSLEKYDLLYTVGQQYKTCFLYNTYGLFVSWYKLNSTVQLFYKWPQLFTKVSDMKEINAKDYTNCTKLPNKMKALILPAMIFIAHTTEEVHATNT